LDAGLFQRRPDRGKRGSIRRARFSLEIDDHPQRHSGGVCQVFARPVARGARLWAALIVIETHISQSVIRHAILAEFDGFDRQFLEHERSALIEK
jgi:hypothetical protein